MAATSVVVDAVTRSFKAQLKEVQATHERERALLVREVERLSSVAMVMQPASVHNNSRSSESKTMMKKKKKSTNTKLAESIPAKTPSSCRFSSSSSISSSSSPALSSTPSYSSTDYATTSSDDDDEISDNDDDEKNENERGSFAVNNGNQQLNEYRHNDGANDEASPLPVRPHGTITGGYHHHDHHYHHQHHTEQKPRSLSQFSYPSTTYDTTTDDTVDDDGTVDGGSNNVRSSTRSSSSGYETSSLGSYTYSRSFSGTEYSTNRSRSRVSSSNRQKEAAEPEAEEEKEEDLTLLEYVSKYNGGGVLRSPVVDKLEEEIEGKQTLEAEELMADVVQSSRPQTTNNINSKDKNTRITTNKSDTSTTTTTTTSQHDQVVKKLMIPRLDFSKLNLHESNNDGQEDDAEEEKVTATAAAVENGPNKKNRITDIDP